MTGEEGAPLALDLIAGNEPDVPPWVNRSLQELAFSALAFDWYAENAPEHLKLRDLTFAGLRLTAPRTFAHGLSKQEDRLRDLIVEAASETDKAPANVGGPEVTLDELIRVPGVLPFMSLAITGEPLAVLYDELIALDAKGAGLSADLGVATAVAVDPERAAQDRALLSKLDRVAARRPRVALIARVQAQDLLVAAAERAMASQQPDDQFSGLILAREVAEGLFPLMQTEGLCSRAVAQRLKPKIAALVNSPDSRVSQAAADATFIIDLAVDFSE